MVGCVSGSMGLSGEITNYLINLDIIEIIQFCLKIYDLWRHLHLWVGVWVVGWMGGSVGQWVGSGQPTDPPNHPHSKPWVGVCLQIINLQTELNDVN